MLIDLSNREHTLALRLDECLPALRGIDDIDAARYCTAVIIAP